jgi:DNA polymerase III alpha subunit (gram-positive type)
MARQIMPGLKRYALWFVAQELKIEIKQEHRALSDVELALSVFYRLKEMIKTKEIVDFDKFFRLFSIDPLKF